MKVLLIGAGVIGTVYGTQLAAGGHTVAVLAHGERTGQIAKSGLVSVDAATGLQTKGRATVVADSGVDTYDIVLVTLRREQIGSAWSALANVANHPVILFFANNPYGHASIKANLPGEVRLGFPGVGGAMLDGVARYARIPQQPTALETTSDSRVEHLARTLAARGFKVQRVRDMSGWLAYHAVFISCIVGALQRSAMDPRRLADDRGSLELMCQAMSEGFAGLQRKRVGGPPVNLRLLLSAPMRPFALRYWSRLMRSPQGELFFAGHARHAEAEMRVVRDDVLAILAAGRQSQALGELLAW